MNLQSLIVVILRLMALNFALGAVIQLFPQLLRLGEVSLNSGLSGSGRYLVLAFVMAASMLGGGILVWVYALPIARLVTRDVSSDLSFGSLSLVDCYSVAFLGTGLYFIANHFPQVLNWAHFLFVSAASPSGNVLKVEPIGYQISQAVIPFIAGILMFTNGRFWAVSLARSQGKSESANQPGEGSASNSQ